MGHETEHGGDLFREYKSGQIQMRGRLKCSPVVFALMHFFVILLENSQVWCFSLLFTVLNVEMGYEEK